MQSKQTYRAEKQRQTEKLSDNGWKANRRLKATAYLSDHDLSFGNAEASGWKKRGRNLTLASPGFNGQKHNNTS